MPVAKEAKPGAALNQHILATLERCGHLRHLKQLQAHLLVLGHGQTQFFSFKLLRFSAAVLADLRYARSIFDTLPSPNIFLYTAMITAYSSHSDPSSAALLFRQMLRGGRPRPNQFIFPHALRSFSESSSPSSIAAVHAQVAKTGFARDGVVQTSLLDAYAKCLDVDTARRLFDEMAERNVVSWTAMITGYARAGMIGNATTLFEEMPHRDVPAWNAIVAAYSQNGLFSEAMAQFRRMIAASARPNETTAVCVLSACGHLGTLLLAKSIHAYTYRNRIGPSAFVSNALLDVYGKCGSLRQARHLFDEMPHRSLTLWNSMINCLALHGRSGEALEIFEEMQRDGPPPDAVTFVGLLNACAHGGLVNEGRRYFRAMAAGYGVERRIEHYGCMVDLLCRAGRFEEAMELVEGMRAVEPDEVVWGSLLNGCRVHGEVKMAERAARKLLEMDPENGGYGVLLANLYSATGRWEEMGGVRKAMKETAARKLPGCSWIELESEVHRFYSGDRSHPRAGEIIDALEGLAAFLER